MQPANNVIVVNGKAHVFSSRQYANACTVIGIGTMAIYYLLWHINTGKSECDKCIEGIELGSIFCERFYELICFYFVSVQFHAGCAYKCAF